MTSFFLAARTGRLSSAGLLLLALVLLSLGPVVYAAPLGITTLLPVAVLAAGLLAWRHGALDVPSIARALVCWLPLFAVMFASGFWALDQRAAALLALRLTLVLVIGVALILWCRSLPTEMPAPLLAALAAGLIAADLLVLADLALGGVLSRFGHGPRADFDFVSYYGRGATIQAILLAPLCWGLWRSGRRALALVHLGLAVVTLLATHDLSAKVALAGAVGGGLAAFALPRLKWVFLIVVALVGLALPLAFPITLDRGTECWMFVHKKSALHRLYIWDFVAGRIDERPWLGWGLDAARRIPGGQETIALGEGCPDATPVMGQKLPLHPHNAILQIWLELGAAGLLAAGSGLLVSLARAYRRAGRGAGAVLVAASLAGTLVALVSYGIWQEWFLSALLLTAAVAALAVNLDTARPLEHERPR